MSVRRNRVSAISPAERARIANQKKQGAPNLSNYSFARMMKPNPNKQVKELPPQPVHEKPRKRFFGIF